MSRLPGVNLKKVIFFFSYCLLQLWALKEWVPSLWTSKWFINTISSFIKLEACGYMCHICLPNVSKSCVIYSMDIQTWIFTFWKQFFNEALDFFIASWITQIWLTAAKLTCPCNTFPTLNSFARSDTGVVIDSEPHLSRTCKTSLLFAPLAVRVQVGCSAFDFTFRLNR